MVLLAGQVGAGHGNVGVAYGVALVPEKQAAAQGTLAPPGVGVLHLCFPTHVPGDLYLAAGTGTGQTGRMIRIGVVTPHAAIGPEAEFPAMAPGWITTWVARIPVDMAAADVMGGPPTAVAARALSASPQVDRAAKDLAAGAVEVIGFASTSSAYLVGFDGEAGLVARISRHAGVPAAATCASALLALRVLATTRIALIHPPWFDEEINRLGAAYFQSQGVKVVSVASADLPLDPERIEPSAVYEWTSRHVPADAEAIFLGGNGFLASGAIEALEATLGRPVLTANQVLLWALLGRSGATIEVNGYGRLFGMPIPGD
jgi:maleate isomerase